MAGEGLEFPNILGKFGSLDILSVDHTAEKGREKAKGLRRGQGAASTSLLWESCLLKVVFPSSSPKIPTNTSDAAKFTHASSLFSLEKHSIEH